MQTLRIGQGYTRSWTVTLRYGRGHELEGQPVANEYSGAEALTLTLAAGGSAVSLSASSATWLAPAAATITLALDDSDTATIAAGRYRLAIVLDDGGEPTEVFEAVLYVEARP